jgi:short-subunit dehydrogenase
MTDAGKYALVTGASSGIGWHIAQALARKGYSIIAVSNQSMQLDDLKKNLEEKYGVTVIPFHIDLTFEDSAQQVFNFCRDNLLSVEVLINNAGIYFFGEVIRVDQSAMRSMLTLHVMTPVLLCRLFGEQMVERGRGFILNVSSITSVMPYPGISMYGPTKTFIRHFTRALRTEMRIYKINVTCLIPGAVDTALYDASNYNISLLKKLRIMKQPSGVADAGVKAVFTDKAECIPGLLNKFIVIFLPVVPHFVINWINRKTDITRRS